MQFIALIYNTEGNDDVDWETLMQQYGKFGDELQQSGGMLGGDALQPVSTSTSVRVRDGKTQIIDGPFAETKEQLGGFYLIDCKNLDEAITWAAKIPTARYGTIEVRPVMVFEQED
jgi:hypothetical protein